MIRNLPKKRTFMAAVILAAIGLIVFTVHLINNHIHYIGIIGYSLVAAAYGLLFLGLTVKKL